MNSKRIIIHIWLMCICLLFVVPLYAQQKFAFSPLVSDHMVLQRHKPNVLKGSGVPGRSVLLEFAGKEYRTVVNQGGHWRIDTEPLSPGEPRQIVAISGEDTLQVNDVRIGDVWICSGQSNMEFSVGSFLWAKEEQKKAVEGDIWYYTLPNTLDLIPSDELPASQWKAASGNDLLQLSATAYFFAKHVQPEIGVPIGLIVSAWSGTAIEPWMEKESLRPFPQFKEVLTELDGYTLSKKEVEANFSSLRRNGWDNEHYLTGKGITEKWYLPETDFSGWQPIRNPGYWEDQEIGLNDFDGVVWYRTSFDLPEDFSSPSFHLFLGYIKDYNRVWVNGHCIGDTFGDKNWSDYYVPSEYLKPKNNTLVVRVLNVEGNGGINYHPLWETPILAGEWFFKADHPIDRKLFPAPQIMNVNPFSMPSILYNAMIHPLKDCAVTGFIWYQGESNVGRGYEYRSLFPAMIDSWRKSFNQGELPFYFVQLANHLPEKEQPDNSQWAELRESQQKALHLPFTGMAVTIDIGEAADIHPQNKQEVGRRLALQALAKTYGKKSNPDSPYYESACFEDGKAVITFRTSSPLRKVTEGEPVYGFELAGEDHCFHKAIVEQIGENTVCLSSPGVEQPVAVRYAWADNPGVLNLQNGSRLPVAPFRSDSWEGITDNRVFDLNIIYF